MKSINIFTDFDCLIIGVHAKSLESTLLLLDFSKAFDFSHKRKTERTQQTYGLPKETTTFITMLY